MWVAMASGPIHGWWPAAVFTSAYPVDAETVTVLQDHDRLHCIMKDGQFHTA
jgi:hypothetical protein